MNRAYSILNVRSVEDGERILRGMATTPSPDRMGDIVEPLGVAFTNPLPLLWQHEHDKPVGTVEFEKPTKSGIPFVARIAKVADPGNLKDRVDEAWQSIQLGLVRAVSIGFRALEYSLIDGGGVRFIKTEVVELSAVTIPANADCTITSIKSIDTVIRAAVGISEPEVDRTCTPRVRGSHPIVKSQPKGVKPMAKTIAEQISAFEATRVTKAAELETIMTGAEGETLDAESGEAADALAAEISSLDDHIKRLRLVEGIKASTAKPVKDLDTDRKAADARAAVIVKAPQKLEAGLAFARIAKVKGLARLDGESPREIAKSLYGEDSVVYGHFTKAAVPAANAGNTPWAGNLVTDGSAFADFVEFLRPQTILGKFGTGNIPALRRIPFDTPVLIQNTGGVGYWVGEGKAKPLTSWTTSRTTMAPLKVATIAAITEEMLRRSSIDADIWIRDELARAVAARIDQTFIDPAAAAVAGVSPASITNGVTPVISSGNDADAVRSDIRALSATFRATNNSASGTVWVMPESIAEALSMMLNPLGQPEFGGITSEGGTFLGKPVITSEFVPSAYDPDGGGAATAGAIVALVKASDVFFGDEGGVTVDFSREASLEMADNPASNSGTPTGANMVSMFQTNSVAFRAERALNWMKRRPEAVAVLASVNWGE